MTADAGAVEEVLAALADSTRRLLREALVAHGQAAATMLAAEFRSAGSRQSVVKYRSGTLGSR